MSMEATSKQEEVGTQPAKTAEEILHIKRTQEERERRFQYALEADDVREALKILHAREKSG
jgi:hypothetical protein